MSGFGVGQGAGGPAVAVLRSIGEPGKASPIRGGGRTANRIRRREPGKIVAVWSSISQRACLSSDFLTYHSARMSGFGADQGTGATAVAMLRSIGEPGKASP